MSGFFSVILLSIGLSMDAFSLALILGTIGLNKKSIIKISITVGLFHLIMPLLGDLVGELLLSVLPIKSTTIAGIIFLVLSVQMFLSIIKESDRTTPIINGTLSIIIFAFTVSIDSFSSGISFSAISTHHYLVSFLFMITSFSFTMTGLVMGKKLERRFGKYATIIGSIILMILAINYLI